MIQKMVLLDVFMLLALLRFCNSFVIMIPTPLSCRRSPAATSTFNLCSFFALQSENNLQATQASKQTVWDYLIDQFQGDFNNYNQVVQDRKDDLLPREGGGHENFHCTLVPLSETSRLAAFYFDGNPQRIFRFRYYELLSESPSGKGDIEMKLYTLHPDLEKIMRSHSEEPLKWPAMFDSFDLNDRDKISYLQNCEIAWSFEMDPTEHSYAMSGEEENGVHAVMVHGEAIVDSTIIPGMKIRILDQLSLSDDVFYINDRGLHPETGGFIYGNQRGVPYRLQRVSRLINGERTIVNEDLKWTMGPKWRSEKEYESKIDAIGGPSAMMSGKPRKGSPVAAKDSKS